MIKAHPHILSHLTNYFLSEHEPRTPLQGRVTLHSASPGRTTKPSLAKESSAPRIEAAPGSIAQKIIFRPPGRWQRRRCTGPSERAAQSGDQIGVMAAAPLER